MSRKWFGTDGIRGVANTELTPELALHVAQACAQVLGSQQPAGQRSYVLMGRDTRISGTLLESALAAGFCSCGVDVHLLGIVPTPTVAWLVAHSDAMAGVMISASHNPAPDNGIKFFSHTGEKLPDTVESAIESLLEPYPPVLAQRPTGADVGQCLAADPTLLTRYGEALAITAPISLKGLRVLIDTAHGAMSDLAPQILRRLGVTVTVIHNHPNGLNINQNCGSTSMESLYQALQQGQYDLGLAFDGDGDRCLAATPHGELIDGDQIMYLCSRYLPNLQQESTIAATVMSNLGFEQALKRRGQNLLRAQVGDRYVLEAMKEHQCKLGGEQSGHVIFQDFQVTGDGLLTAIQLLCALQLAGRPIEELLTEVPRLPQLLQNVKVAAEHLKTWQKQPQVQAAIAKCESDIAGRGRILVRASGTEPKIRVMAEGQNQVEVAQVVSHLVGVIQHELG